MLESKVKGGPGEIWTLPIIAEAPAQSPFFLWDSLLWTGVQVWRNDVCQRKELSSALNVVVSGFGKMAFGILVWEKNSGTRAKTAPIDSHDENNLHLPQIPFFFLLIASMIGKR